MATYTLIASTGTTCKDSYILVCDSNGSLSYSEFFPMDKYTREKAIEAAKTFLEDLAIAQWKRRRQQDCRLTVKDIVRHPLTIEA